MFMFRIMTMTTKNHIFVTGIVIILARPRADHTDWLGNDNLCELPSTMVEELKKKKITACLGDGQIIKNLPSNAADAGSIPG